MNPLPTLPAAARAPQVISSNPGCYFILLGDFNCNIYDRSHPFTPILRDLLNCRQFICTLDLFESIDPNASFTRTNYGAAGSGSLLTPTRLKGFPVNLTLPTKLILMLISTMIYLLLPFLGTTWLTSCLN